MVGLTHNERCLIYNLRCALKQPGSKPRGLCCLGCCSATSLP